MLMDLCRLAFVTMRSKEEADVLMQEFDTMLWHGRALSVQLYEKKPRQEMLKGESNKLMIFFMLNIS